MTLQMFLALGILIFMIVLIMFDVLPFGAPPILACLLLVVTGLSTVQEAFAGFVNNSVVMIAGFMVVMAAIQKTSLITSVKNGIIALINKGGYKSYAALIIIAMLGASLVGGGNTGYYVLILSLLVTLPYSKKMPTSKLLLPMGFATNHPLLPFNVALYFGVAVSILESNGYMDGINMTKFALVNFAMNAAFLVWCLVAFKLLPDHPLSDASQADIDRASAELEKLPKWKENVVIISFVVAIVAMMMMNKIGNAAYVIPGLCGAVCLFIGVLDFKEVRDSMGAPVILMMAGVIGVADALANSGFTAMLGESMAKAMGGSANAFLVILVFGLLTSTCATFTGSNMGSVYIFAPIAIATCMSLGLNPVAAATVCTVCGWQGGYMPIDGLPALIYGMGKYKLPEFWKFTIPMYFIRIIALAAAAVVIFPM